MLRTRCLDAHAGKPILSTNAHPPPTTLIVLLLAAALSVGCNGTSTTEAHPMEAETLIAEGLELLDAGKNGEALKRFTSATKADPANGQAFYCLGCVLAELNRHEEAVDAFASSAELAPDRAALPLFNMGNSLKELKQVDEAVKTFRKVTQLDATDADAWTNLGGLLAEQGQHTEAVRCYETALEHAPDDVVTLTNRGNSLWALGQLQQAIDSYNKALAIDPHDRTAKAAKAACEARLKK